MRARTRADARPHTHVQMHTRARTETCTRTLTLTRTRSWNFPPILTAHSYHYDSSVLTAARHSCNDIESKVASHYWNTRRLNRYTDSGSYEDFKILTKRINGGYNGLTDRTNRWHEARRQLGCAPLRDGCTKGQAGFCIDTNTEECDGADVKSGFCSGAGNIQC